MAKRSRKSARLRQDPYFLRNAYNGANAYDIAELKYVNVNDPSLKFISSKSIKANDNVNVEKCVHFFVDDYDIEKFYNDPESHYKRLAQYRYVLTPDYSMLTDMPIWLQIQNVAKNRWCGRFWQDLGIPVIPSVSWSTKESYTFAFLGIPIGSTVAISTLSTRSSKMTQELFMAGYEAMLKQIKPRTVYCYNKPFPEMEGNIIHIDYLETTGRAC